MEVQAKECKGPMCRGVMKYELDFNIKKVKGTLKLARFCKACTAKISEGSLFSKVKSKY